MKLEIKDLTKTYSNGVRALGGISLTIPSGMFGLLGPNGAGKSTLMRILATLQEADGGSAHLDGIDVLTDTDAVRRRHGYLPQEFGLYPKVSAKDLLEHFCVLKGVAPSGRKRTVDALLKKTNLWDARNRSLGGFSGGMKQRFGIAQALIGQPELIIVDEPTAGLDPEERNRFHNLLAEIGEEVIVILSTHIVDDVADLCPRMAILAGGNIIAEGQPNALVGALAGRIFRRAIDRNADTAAANRELEAIRAAHRVISTRRSAGRTVLHVYAETPPTDSSFEPVPPDLEDVYFLALDGVAGKATATAPADPA